MELRKLIYELKTTADTIVEKSEQYPKQAAAAMKMLANRVTTSKISPNSFRELSDKEYAGKAISLIQTENDRLFAKLNQEEKQEVDHVLETLHRLSDYKYYLSNYSAYMLLQDAKNTMNLYAEAKNRMIVLGIIGVIVIVVVLSLLGALIPYFGHAIIVFYLIGLWKYTKADKYYAAKKTVDSMKFYTISDGRYSTLHERYKTDVNARTLQSNDEHQVRLFFGDSNLSPL